MPILRCGDQIRLSGKEAADYLEETSRSRLPTTIREYNRALNDTVAYWLSANCPEGQLLAAMLRAKLISAK
ncbi:MAG: hypothetical protein CTY33_02920 [Methylotenera sp.]|nr:MAG: hypothetical protein CTY33_02920 [Methylotenera sp.]